MLISHSHKFIFIKSKKVAGTSIQSYLSQFCKNGIVYDRNPKSHLSATETIRLVGKSNWENYLKITAVRNPWDKLVSQYYWRRRKRPFYVGVWRVLKGMSFKSPAKLPFKDYVHFLNDRGVLNEDCQITYVNDDLPEYYFIRYEHLHHDLEQLMGKIGEVFDIEALPQKKSGFRDRRKDYRDYYDEETRNLISLAFKKEIDRFKYTF